LKNIKNTQEKSIMQEINEVTPVEFSEPKQKLKP